MVETKRVLLVRVPIFRHLVLAHLLFSAQSSKPDKQFRLPRFLIFCQSENVLSECYLADTNISPLIVFIFMNGRRGLRSKQLR